MASKLGASLLRQSRHDDEFHLMKLRKRFRCFTKALPGSTIISAFINTLNYINPLHALRVRDLFIERLFLLPADHQSPPPRSRQIPQDKRSERQTNTTVRDWWRLPGVYRRFQGHRNRCRDTPARRLQKRRRYRHRQVDKHADVGGIKVH